MNVLLLQMAHDEEVEDLGNLDSTLLDITLPETSGWGWCRHPMRTRAPR
jgi:DNA-binding response OmpR family regulator